ncbi:hypothetical protein [Bremerella alba]|uniref:Uncharacterized protein n=1 Tax=Bremerella alba TaxID=980252 RepID=A0A7V8V8B0_9BACT|nr:hypothetical protein [Bremerella alba]MBA2116804.1 hypothetical protein [Bremerella alba]
MDLPTLITCGGLSACSVLLIATNWSQAKQWLPRLPSTASPSRNHSNPAELIEAYHVARDACGDNANLATLTDQVFKDLICRKVLRCEK